VNKTVLPGGAIRKKLGWRRCETRHLSADSSLAGRRCNMFLRVEQIVEQLLAPLWLQPSYKLKQAETSSRMHYRLVTAVLQPQNRNRTGTTPFVFADCYMRWNCLLKNEEQISETVHLYWRHSWSKQTYFCKNARIEIILLSSTSHPSLCQKFRWSCTNLWRMSSSGM
jgi:hypothetical protein